MLSESYGRGYNLLCEKPHIPIETRACKEYLISILHKTREITVLPMLCGFRHPKEGLVKTPHRADLRFPPSAPLGGLHPCMQYGFTCHGEEYECSALEECSLARRALEWKLRMLGEFFILRTATGEQ